MQTVKLDGKTNNCPTETSGQLFVFCILSVMLNLHYRDSLLFEHVNHRTGSTSGAENNINHHTLSGIVIALFLCLFKGKLLVALIQFLEQTEMPLGSFLC